MQMPNMTRNAKTNLTWAGFFFGLCFPVVGTFVQATLAGVFSLSSFWQVQRQTPLLWIIDIAPLILALAGRLISENYQFTAKPERQFLPLLVTGLLIPLVLLMFALGLEAKATQIVNDTNRSGALRYKSLYIYAVTKEANGNTAWRSKWDQMNETRSDLRARYPQEVAAWQEFSQQLRSSGKVDWLATEQMRRAADVLTGSLEQYQGRYQKTFTVIVT
ncbi:hypothetical protein EON80_19190, partial [bacterium]